MYNILHISADFPDAYSERKTPAVCNLIEGAPEFTHTVFSINRLAGLQGTRIIKRADNVITLVYKAPPFGVLLDTFLRRLADHILEDIQGSNMRPDLIHAHKLTIEGLVAQRLSQALGCPYVCTIRGNTDQKYIRAKPGMRRRWRQVAQQAAWLFPVTPWVDRYVSKTLLPDTGQRSLLPTVTRINHNFPPRETSRRLVTAFHLAGWKMKGMPGLFTALRQLRGTAHEIGLDILGGGSPEHTQALQREIEKHGLGDLVTLRGAIPHDQMAQELNGYSGFVLPTLRETFGMVYIEALFSGIPILYSMDRGVDGFFDEQNVGVRCDPTSVASIAKGIEEMLDNVDPMKHEIAMLQQTGGFDRFRQHKVCRDYADRAARIIENGSEQTRLDVSHTRPSHITGTKI
ncbi:MAG: glycosyltransferase [Pseudomonadota bacterium]